jgi:hypothetical protein
METKTITKTITFNYKMSHRKIILAVDCENDQQQQAVQEIAKELSATFQLSAASLIRFYPFVKKHKALLYTAVKTIATEGKKGIVKIVPMLLKNL